MTSGFEWNKNVVLFDRSTHDHMLMMDASDPIEYFLVKPVVHEPGKKWHYNTGGTEILGEVIQEATGLRIDAFAEEYLFGPLGITEYQWNYINPDMVGAGASLHLRPRDMAKLGYLFLNGGVWNGEQIVSSEWIEESTQKHATARDGYFYGYQWWIKTYDVGSTKVDSFSARGSGGQRIMVIPDLEMVVVFTGGTYFGDSEGYWEDNIIVRYILPAVD
jgi:CubicO group peptidase (beta-lactamase class C family)